MMNEPQQVLQCHHPQKIEAKYFVIYGDGGARWMLNIRIGGRLKIMGERRQCVWRIYH